MEKIGKLTFSACSTLVSYDYDNHKLFVKYDVIREYECNVAMYSQIMSGDRTMLEMIIASQVGVVVSKLPKGLVFTELPEPTIDMYSVNSSNVKAVGYDVNNMVLYVEYDGGGVYQYENVPANYWSALQNADSKGSWLHWFLKINDSEFPYSKTSGYNLSYTGKTTANTGAPHPNGYMTGFGIEE